MSVRTVKLGLMPPLTGLVGIYGTEISQAGQIACKEVNDAGGVLGKPLELVIEDDGSLPHSAVIAARRLVRKHRCAAIIGNLLSNSRIAVAYQVAEPDRIPYLNFSFYEGSILSHYFFHFAALPNQQIDRMIPYMRTRFGPRMFFAGNNYEWPRGSIDAAKHVLSDTGGEVVGEEYRPFGMADETIETLLDQVEAAAPDVFVPYFAGDDQLHLLTHFTQRGMKHLMAVVMGHFDEVMASRLPADVREGFYSCNTYFMSVDTPENRSYLAALSALPDVDALWPRGNGILTNFGEGTYLCIKAFAAAANRAGSLDTEKLVAALSHVEVSSPQGSVRMEPATHHARVNTYLACCRSDGTFKIIEAFGAIDPVLPERYRHLKIAALETTAEDIQLQSRMLEQMSEAVFLIRIEDMSVVYTNSGAERMFGYGHGELIGSPVTILDAAETGDTGTQLSVALDTFKHKGIWQGEVKNGHRDGGEFWCAASASLFSHPLYGEVWMAVLTDITGQKQAEKALKKNERMLIERVKELRCLYQVSALCSKTDLTEHNLLRESMPVVAAGFQYPEITCVRICLEDREFVSEDFQESPWVLTSGLDAGDLDTGQIEVYYREERPAETEGPFLAEERALLDTVGDLLGRAIESRRSEEALLHSERRFRALTENASDLIVIVDAEGIITYASPSLMRIGGYTTGEILGHNFLDFLHPDDRAAGMQTMRKALAQPHNPVVSERRFRHRDGHYVVLESALKNALADPAVAGVVVNARDVTDRKKAEAELLTRNRTLRTLMECNQALVRATDEIQLLQDVCDIIIEYGGFRMAWVGHAEPRQQVRVVAHSGHGATEYLAGARITWDETPHGRGPAGLALSSRAPAFVDDIRTDPRFEPWRAAAQRHGYRACAALPLQTPDGELVGVLTIYAAQAGAFGVEASTLLQELASDLAFGIRTLRDQAEHRRAEERLRLANAVVESSPTVLFRWRNEKGWPVEYVSDNVRQFEYEAADFMNGGIDYARIIHKDDIDRVTDEVSGYVDSGATEFSQEYRITTRSGEVRWVEDHTSIERSTDSQVDHFQGTVTDITERKLQANRIAHLSRIRAVLSAINSSIVRVHERQELFDDACHIAVTEGGFTMAWIGWRDADSGEIRPVAKAGEGIEDYLSDLVFNVKPDASSGDTQLANALRTRKPSIHNKLETDEAFKNRDNILALGLRSAGIFPLRLNGEPQGVLVLYSSETGFFDADELALLKELVDDISFAINHIAQEEKVNYLAFYDSLTGLANRAYFHERADQMLREANRLARHAAIVLIDLERFRGINESLGLPGGDELLKRTAERLRQVCGEQTLLARVEADRYALLLTDVNETNFAHYIDTVMAGCFAAPFTIDGNEIRVSARFGIALYPDDANNAEALYANAEVALLKAKRSAERFVFYEPEMNLRVADRLKVESRLRDAVTQNQFVLYYQPKISTRTRAIVGLEALIRWNDPEASLVPPDEFIAILEDTGLIVPVGHWALEQARRDHHVWQSQGLAAPRIAVNLSAIQLRRKDFAESAVKIVEGDPDHGLDLELTESLLMENLQENREKLKTLRQAGFRIAVDDFGTGYSSLAYIAKLPLDYLKIDRSFITKMAESAEDMAIVQSIIALGHNLDLKIVAEGVETEEQAKLLRLLKCDELQGYLFGKPMPASEIAKLLENDTTEHEQTDY